MQKIRKKSLIGSLVFLVIIFSLTIPLLPSTVVKASPAVEIRNWYDLHAVRNNLGGSYILMNDLDATTAGYMELASETANEGRGWQPIGIYQPDGLFEPFTGTFDGQGYEIRDLFVNRPDEGGAGLFRAVVAGEEGEGGCIKNVGVVNAHVTGYMNVGGLTGFNSGNISNSYCTGEVTGNWSVGGLVGLNAGNVSNSYSSAKVTGMTGGWFAGGLIGQNTEGTVSNCYASGNVTGDTLVGGLVGHNERGTITNSYSRASVVGQQGLGGLLGGNDGGRVKNSYSSGNVTGETHIGGLVGYNWNWGAVVGSCYATGSVTGNRMVGGLVGCNDYYATVLVTYAAGSVVGNSWVGGLVGYNLGATVSDSYARGSVTGNSSVGGLVGANNGTVSNSFWDRQTSGMRTSNGGVGKTTAQMRDIATFTNTKTDGLDNPWNITAVAHGETNDAYAWNIVDGKSYPFLSGKQFVAYDLTIFTTDGGDVTAPGLGTFTYVAGTVVHLTATPDPGYRFGNWTGDVDTIADVTAARTTMSMNGSYTIRANFEKTPPQINWLLIGAIIAAVVVVRLLVLFIAHRRKVR